MARPILSAFLLISLWVSAFGSSSTNLSNDLAVIVNKKNGVVSLTSRDLRNILLGETEQWVNGQKIIAASLSTDLPETKIVLKQICGMSEGDFKRYFMQLTFQGKPIYPPRIMKNAAAIKALVTNTPGALGIIPARDVDEFVSVVSLDGNKPGSPTYKLAINK